MPIIASKVGGLAESLDKYKGTVFVSPQDIQELAAALNDVLVNKYGIVYPLPDSLQWDNISLEWLELFQKIAP
jgi:glycosyltransferase involved in cell wall biosynthesis